jgi:hypothetical protein
MPLLDPLNAGGCLGKLHESVRAFRDTQTAQQLARHCETPEQAAVFIRTLDQRDDFGDPKDGPRLSCEVSQRLRLPTLDPNCFERTAMYLALVSILDPDREVTSATLMVDNGLHSFPVEIVDDIPRAVVLDPSTAGLENALNATAYQLRNASPMAKDHIGPWFNELAWNACAAQGVEDCYETAMGAIRNSLLTGEPISATDEIDCVLSLARADADLYGAQGRTAFDRVDRSVRNLSLSLDRGRVAKVLTKVARHPLAAEAIKLALVAEFGPVAAIALQGVDLGIAAPKPKTGPALDQADDDEQMRALLAVVNREDDEDDDDDEPVTTRAEIHRRMRHMTLGFRQPSRKDS